MLLDEKRNRELAEKLFGHIRDDSTDTVEDFFEYDLRIYSDPDVAVKERERIFRRLPMMALHSSQLPEPGTFVTVELNETFALVTRDKAGKIHAFQNVCRHRGATLATAASGKQSRFSCPYHGWTYDNAGTLVGVSFRETTGVELPCASRNLIELPVEERNGFIWIVENPEGSIDMAGYLGEMDEILAGYGLDQWYCYRDAVLEIPQNWKIMVDGLIDGYHVSFVHGPTIKPYFYLNMMATLMLEGGHTVTTTPRRKFDQILDQEPGETPIDKYVVFGNLILPNVSMQLHPHHVEFWTMYQDPKDPAKCRAHLRFLTPKPASGYDEAGLDVLEKNWEIAEAAILNEDVPVGNSIQRSANIPGVPKVMLTKNEIINQRFHRTYKKYMDGAA